MFNFGKMKFAYKLWGLIFFFAVGLTFFGFYSHQTIQYLKVNGPIYDKIIQGKDLIADILPPPNYLVESYLVTLQLLDEQDNDKLKELIKKSETLRADYNTRHEYWEKNLAEGEVKDLLIRQSHEAAVRFLDIRDNQVIPAVLNGNRELAKQIANSTLKEAYEQHRHKVDLIVEKTNAINADVEKEAAASITVRTASLIFFGILILGLIILAAYYLIIKKLVLKIRGLVRSAENLKVGDIKSAELNLEEIRDNSLDESKDEIAELTRSFTSMVETIKEQSAAVDSIAQGNLAVIVKIKSDEDVLAKSITSVTHTLTGLLNETNTLVLAASKGKLSVRSDSNKFNGGYKDIVTGINKTLDLLIDPLNMAAEYIDLISKGNIPGKITEKYEGEFNNIKNNLNTCIDSIQLLIDDAKYLADSAVEGNLTARADESKHNGDFRKIISGVNNTLDFVVSPLTVAADYVNRISKGDIPEKITEEYKGDYIELKNNLNTCIDAINNLIEDSNMLSSSALDGNLQVRAIASKHQGDFRKIINGVNNTLDAVISPLNIAAEYINRIGEGEIPKKITDDYKGDFNSIKNSINSCIDGLEGLVEISAVLQKMSLNDYSKEVTGNYKGIFAETGNSVNLVITRLNHVLEIADQISQGDLHKLELLEQIKKRSENDKLIPALIRMMSAIQDLVTKAETLTNAALEGKLSVRADISEQNGVFKKIVEGMNKTLDAVVTPLNIAALYINNISRGELSDNITETFEGDFNDLKVNLNTCIASINYLIRDIDAISASAVEGELSKRADAEKHQGDFKKIINGLNQTLDAILTPVNEGISTLQVLAKGDFTAKISSRYKGEHALIKESINAMTDSIAKALGNVNEAVLATASAGNQISSSTEEMAAGTQEQTQHAIEVVKSVEEMTKTILDNTKNALSAAETAKSAGSKAVEGDKIVGETIEGMIRIEEVVKKAAKTVYELGKSSDQIGEIVQVINDIADQTNLLALNAAIEAARAGEQGRGFAVVADEVRKLAERTTKATKEIASMISKIQKDTTEAVHSMDEGTREVESGKQKADKAGQSLIEIISEANKVVDIVTQVAAASEQQSSAAEEISRNIDTISSVTQESATGIQQIAHAAEDLSRLTLNLENLVGQFKITSNNPNGNSSYRLN